MQPLSAFRSQEILTLVNFPGQVFLIFIKSFAEVNAFLALVNLFLEKFADLVLGCAFLLRRRFHLVDVIGCLQANDIKDLERSLGSTGRESPGQVDRLRAALRKGTSMEFRI